MGPSRGFRRQAVKLQGVAGLHGRHAGCAGIYGADGGGVEGWAIERRAVSGTKLKFAAVALVGVFVWLGFSALCVVLLASCARRWALGSAGLGPFAPCPPPACGRLLLYLRKRPTPPLPFSRVVAHHIVDLRLGASTAQGGAFVQEHSGRHRDMAVGDKVVEDHPVQRQ